ncbi:hypothetical protein LBMAG42_40340 [Deltaproteobacteria bacterium]|nr:hypothetical protein LBMAG42_40340 [Deltaproteobacteria bacterium]
MPATHASPLAVAFLLAATACAESADPVEVSLYSAADEVTYLDGEDGRVRVHYSDRGPNAIDQTDRHEDGVPDRALEGVYEVEQALSQYAYLGFAEPFSEAEAGREGAGGSAALDVYLANFPTEDWVEAVQEACVGRRCSDSLRLQSDDDSSLESDIVHQVFHLVQDSYDATEPAWLREGTADFMSGSLDPQPYLDATDCGLAETETEGRCGDVAASTSLLWAYLDLEAQISPDVLLRTIEATASVDGVAALEAGLRAENDTLARVWPLFAAQNLATGVRQAEDGSGYAYNSSVTGITATGEGAAIHDTRTFAPLSARYYRVEHAGGELWLGLSGDGSPLRVSVHPVLNGANDGPVGHAEFGAVPLPSERAFTFPSLDAGGVWLSVTHVDPDAESTTVTFCAGTEADATLCETGAGCATGGGGSRPLGGIAATLALLYRRRRIRNQNPGPPNTR